jgi:hypothetical protein
MLLLLTLRLAGRCGDVPGGGSVTGLAAVVLVGALSRWRRVQGMLQAPIALLSFVHVRIG